MYVRGIFKLNLQVIEAFLHLFLIFIFCFLKEQ